MPKKILITEQRGAASSTPSALKRFITSKFMTKISSTQFFERQRRKGNLAWRKSAARAQIIYFHQIDHPHSYLCSQTLSRLQQRYDIEIKAYLVSEPTAQNNPNPLHASKLAAQDARQVAPFYHLEYNIEADHVDEESVLLGSQILSECSAAEFLEYSPRITAAVLNNDRDQLNLWAKQFNTDGHRPLDDLFKTGNRIRSKMGHYSSGMFYFNGEVYTGVDRLYHLEQRLIELDLVSREHTEILYPRPSIDALDESVQHDLILEFYPSLRSPYTAIVFDQVVEYCKANAIDLELKPVLPMVMRGVPITSEKGRYIMFDVGREARASGATFGPVYDPIGEPILKCYSLYPWARDQGRHIELFSNFLKAAFHQGKNLLKEQAFRDVVVASGLDWTEAQSYLGDTRWQAEFEANRLDMLSLNSWGVPSFKLKSNNSKTIISAWGQDRFWLITRFAQRAISEQ